MTRTTEGDARPGQAGSRYVTIALRLAVLAFVPAYLALAAAGICALARSTRLAATLTHPAMLATDVALAAVGVLYYVDGLMGRSLRSHAVGIGSLLVAAWAMASRFDEPHAGTLHHLGLQGMAFVSVVLVIAAIAFVHEFVSEWF